MTRRTLPLREQAIKWGTTINNIMYWKPINLSVHTVWKSYWALVHILRSSSSFGVLRAHPGVSYLWLFHIPLSMGWYTEKAIINFSPERNQGFFYHLTHFFFNRPTKRCSSNSCECTRWPEKTCSGLWIVSNSMWFLSSYQNSCICRRTNVGNAFHLFQKTKSKNFKVLLGDGVQCRCFTSTK